VFKEVVPQLPSNKTVQIWFANETGDPWYPLLPKSQVVVDTWWKIEHAAKACKDGYSTVRVFRQEFTLEDAIGSHLVTRVFA
jgi:hypothetical protein